MRPAAKFAPILLALAAIGSACGGQQAVEAAGPTDPARAAQESRLPAAVTGYPIAERQDNQLHAPAEMAPPSATDASAGLQASQAPAVQPVARIGLNYLIGDVDPAKDPMFSRIPDRYLGGPRAYGHKDAVAAFVRMAQDAEAAGYRLKAVSAFRSFRDQKKIWEDKWSGKTIVGGKQLNLAIPDAKARALKILEFSSMPSTSRHHWGTDFDINSVEPAYFRTPAGAAIYAWLVEHARGYGFCQVYSRKGPGGRTSGYEEEKWHWSYLPVAYPYLKQYPAEVGYEHITGFAGSASAREIDIIRTYVQAINPDCDTPR